MNLNSHKNTCSIKYGVLTLRGSGRAWLTVSLSLDIKYSFKKIKNVEEKHFTHTTAMQYIFILW